MGEGIISGKRRLVFFSLYPNHLFFYAEILSVVLLTFFPTTVTFLFALVWLIDWLTDDALPTSSENLIKAKKKGKKREVRGKGNPKQTIGLRKHGRKWTWTWFILFFFFWLRLFFLFLCAYWFACVGECVGCVWHSVFLVWFDSKLLGKNSA